MLLTAVGPLFAVLPHAAAVRRHLAGEPVVRLDAGEPKGRDGLAGGG